MNPEAGRTLACRAKRASDDRGCGAPIGGEALARHPPADAYALRRSSVVSAGRPVPRHRIVAIAMARHERARASKRSPRWLRRPTAVVVGVRSSDQCRASWGARGRAGPEPADQPPGCRRLLIGTPSASVHRANAFQSRLAADAELWSRGQSPCVARAHPLHRRRGRRAVAAVLRRRCSAVRS